MQIDLKKVIESVGKEKNVDRQLLIGAVKEAVLIAAKKNYGDCVFETKYDEDTEEIELWRYRAVVPDDKHPFNPSREITITEALSMDDSTQMGDEIGEPLSTEQLGRISAQSARQVIVQKMMEAEKDKIIKDFRERKHQLVNGQVRRFDKQDLIVDMGSCEGVLPHREQIPNEKFKLRDKITCYVLDVKKSSRGPQVILSRAHPEMLIRLFEQEVSEISEGIVVINSAARDPGGRSKISVYSNEPSVDPVGACVGLKGARVQSIVQELHGEKIDIIPYDRDSARFVCNALAPSEVSKVIVNERTHTMEVVVPDDQLSLAIGKRGQNVRLAAQLTGWKVDIRSETKMKELVKEYKNILSQISILGEMRAEILVNEGYKDPADVARMDPKILVKLLRLNIEEAEQVITEAADIAQKASSKSDSDEFNEDEVLAELNLNSVDDFPEDKNDTSAEEATIENIVSKAQITPMLDPDKINVDEVPFETLKYWMKLHGIGEHTAAVISIAGFQDYASLANATVEDISYRTGLPFKFVGKIHAESAKLLV